MASNGKPLSPFARDLILGGIVLLLLATCVTYQHIHLRGVKQKWERFEQKTKLPSADVLKIATLGYDNIYADWLWLQSIQAFGMGWITEDMSTEPIYQYFDTLTDLDPHFISAYRFANLIIGDNRLDWERGQDILKKGTISNPDDYQIPYLGLYNAIWHTDDAIQARWFAYRLNRVPDAPNFMKRLEEYIERKAGRYEVSFEYNVRYYLQYIAHDNDIERQIIERRLQSLLDSWYQKELDDAARKYLEINGSHPLQMEDLLQAPYMPDFQAPTIEAFVAALDSNNFEIEQLSSTDEIPQTLVDKIVKASTQRIRGLPPEPFGTWYLIHGPTRYVYEQGGMPNPDGRFAPYILPARDLIDITNQNAMGAQTFIMGYFRDKGELPPEEEMRRFYGRDPMGGHYVYERESPESPIYGVYYSTAAKRIQDGEEPRLGLRGPGPFPFTIEPRLSDHAVDRQWGIEHGYILEDGTELWSGEFSSTGFDNEGEMILP